MKFCRWSIRTAFWLAALTPIAHAQPAPGAIEITPIVTTGMSGALGVTNADDGSNRLFVIEQTGEIRVVRNAVLATTPYLTISSSTQCRETIGGALASTGFTLSSELGLLGLAFHPNFRTNGRFYVSYSDLNGDSIVARFTAASPSADVLTPVDQQSCLIVLRVDLLGGIHNGGNIVFGPDGFLHFALGDGGDFVCYPQTLNPNELGAGCGSQSSFTNPGGGAPNRSALTRALLGKFLRIDINGVTPAGANGLCAARLGGAANYAIPADNPYAGADAQGGCDEIWAHGFRNPWRWSFDRSTGDLIVGDVGESHWEEVSLFPASSGSGRGANADWSVCEGRHVARSCTALCPSAQTSEVIVAYNNGPGCASTPINGAAVTGGYRYRGPDPSLQGVYFFGDAGRNSIYYAVEQGDAWSVPDATSTIVGVSAYSFGEDEYGALFAVRGNRLTRIGAARSVDILFADGFE